MRASDLEVCNLTMTLHEKSAKLEMYEKIQAKIDHVLFPDLPVPGKKNSSSTTIL